MPSLDLCSRSISSTFYSPFPSIHPFFPPESLVLLVSFLPSTFHSFNIRKSYCGTALSLSFTFPFSPTQQIHIKTFLLPCFSGHPSNQKQKTKQNEIRNSPSYRVPCSFGGCCTSSLSVYCYNKTMGCTSFSSHIAQFTLREHSN